MPLPQKAEVEDTVVVIPGIQRTLFKLLYKPL